MYYKSYVIITLIALIIAFTHFTIYKNIKYLSVIFMFIPYVMINGLNIFESYIIKFNILGIFTLIIITVYFSINSKYLYNLIIILIILMTIIIIALNKIRLFELFNNLILIIILYTMIDISIYINCTTNMEKHDTLIKDLIVWEIITMPLILPLLLLYSAITINMNIFITSKSNSNSNICNTISR